MNIQDFRNLTENRFKEYYTDILYPLSPLQLFAYKLNLQAEMASRLPRMASPLARPIANDPNTTKRIPHWFSRDGIEKLVKVFYGHNLEKLDFLSEWRNTEYISPEDAFCLHFGETKENATNLVETMIENNLPDNYGQYLSYKQSGCKCNGCTNCLQFVGSTKPCTMSFTTTDFNQTLCKRCRNDL